MSDDEAVGTLFSATSALKTESLRLMRNGMLESIMNSRRIKIITDEGEFYYIREDPTSRDASGQTGSRHLFSTLFNLIIYNCWLLRGPSNDEEKAAGSPQDDSSEDPAEEPTRR